MIEGGLVSAQGLVCHAGATKANLNYEGQSGVNIYGAVLAAAWVKEFGMRGHPCPSKFFSNGGHREVTSS